MKNIFLFFAFILSSSVVQAQIWLEASALYSIPVQSILPSNTQVTSGQGVAIVYDDREVFQEFAKSNVGANIGGRYLKDQLAFGMEISFVKYRAKTDVLSLFVVRVAPVVEYYIVDEEKWTFFVGGELNIMQSKSNFNSEYIEINKIGESGYGAGVRLGGEYRFNENWGSRLLVNYTGLSYTSSLNFSLGVVMHLGDF